MPRRWWRSKLSGISPAISCSTAPVARPVWLCGRPRRGTPCSPGRVKRWARVSCWRRGLSSSRSRRKRSLPQAPPYPSTPGGWVPCTPSRRLPARRSLRSRWHTVRCRSMSPGRPRTWTRTGICNSGAATSLRSSTAPHAFPKCRPRRRCWKRSTRRHLGAAPRQCGAQRVGRALCLARRVEHQLLLLQRAVSNDGGALRAAEPPEREIVALARHGDGAVGAATAFVGLALGDDLDVEHVGFRRSGAGELSGAVEIRILRLRSPSVYRELELVRLLAADWGEFAAPVAVDTGSGRRGVRFTFCRRLVLGRGRKLRGRGRDRRRRGENQRSAAVAQSLVPESFRHALLPSNTLTRRKVYH